MGRFETEWLATDANLDALTDLPGVWIDRVHERKPPDGIILDMDSSESPTYGEQEDSAYNGHFRCSCYHPLFLFNQFGDLERCLLRPGNVHGADDWRAVLEPVLVRYRARGIELYFRADAAFAKPELYETLEAEDVQYAIRLPANRVLMGRISHLLTRPVGRWSPSPENRFVTAPTTLRCLRSTQDGRKLASGVAASGQCRFILMMVHARPAGHASATVWAGRRLAWLT